MSTPRQHPIPVPAIAAPSVFRPAGAALGAFASLGVLALVASTDVRAQDAGAAAFDPLDPTAGGTLSLDGLEPADVVRIREVLRRLEEDPAAVAAAAGAERDLDHRQNMLESNVDAATAAGVDASDRDAFDRRAAGRLDAQTEALLPNMTPEQVTDLREAADEVAERAPGTSASRVYGEYERAQLDAIDGVYDAGARASLLAEAGGRDVDDKKCSIHLCIFAAFALPGCGVARKEMYKRVFRGKSPIPSFSGCSDDGGDRGYGVRRGTIKIGETVTIAPRPPGMHGPETITVSYDHGNCPNTLRDDPHRLRRLTGRHDPDPMPPRWWRNSRYGAVPGEAEALAALYDAEVARLRADAEALGDPAADRFEAAVAGAYAESDEVEFDGDASNDLADPVAGPNLAAFRAEYCAPAYGWSQAVRDGYAYGETIFTEKEPVPGWYDIRLDFWDFDSLAMAELPYPLPQPDPTFGSADDDPDSVDLALDLRARLLRREDVIERARALVSGEQPVDDPVRPEGTPLPVPVGVEPAAAAPTILSSAPTGAYFPPTPGIDSGVTTFGNGDTNTTIRRISRGLTHAYSRRQAWSADDALLELDESIVDAVTGQVVIDHIPMNSARVWANTEARVMYGMRGSNLMRWDVATGSLTPLMNVGEGCRIGDGEGTISNDDRRLVLACGSELMSVDLPTRSILGRAPKPSRYNWAGVSQSGEWIIVDDHICCNTPRELILYRADFSERVVMADEAQHGDFGMTADGRDAFVMVNGSGNPVFYTLDDGRRHVLDLASPPGHGHISCRNIARPGHCYFTSNNGSVGAFALTTEPQAGEKWGSHGSSGSSYASQPKGSVNRRGTRMIVTSDKGGLGDFIISSPAAN